MLDQDAVPIGLDGVQRFELRDFSRESLDDLLRYPTKDVFFRRPFGMMPGEPFVAKLAGAMSPRLADLRLEER